MARHLLPGFALQGAEFPLLAQVEKLDTTTKHLLMALAWSWGAKVRLALCILFRNQVGQLTLHTLFNPQRTSILFSCLTYWGHVDLVRWISPLQFPA